MQFFLAGLLCLAVSAIADENVAEIIRDKRQYNQAETVFYPHGDWIRNFDDRPPGNEKASLATPNNPEQPEPDDPRLHDDHSGQVHEPLQTDPSSQKGYVERARGDYEIPDYFRDVDQQQNEEASAPLEYGPAPQYQPVGKGGDERQYGEQVVENEPEHHGSPNRQAEDVRDYPVPTNEPNDRTHTSRQFDEQSPPTGGPYSTLPPTHGHIDLYTTTPAPVQYEVSVPEEYPLSAKIYKGEQHEHAPVAEGREYPVADSPAASYEEAKVETPYGTKRTGFISKKNKPQPVSQRRPEHGRSSPKESPYESLRFESKKQKYIVGQPETTTLPPTPTPEVYEEPKQEVSYRESEVPSHQPPVPSPAKYEESKQDVPYQPSVTSHQPHEESAYEKNEPAYEPPRIAQQYESQPAYEPQQPSPPHNERQQDIPPWARPRNPYLRPPQYVESFEYEIQKPTEIPDNDFFAPDDRFKSPEPIGYKSFNPFSDHEIVTTEGNYQGGHGFSLDQQEQPKVYHDSSVDFWRQGGYRKPKEPYEQPGYLAKQDPQPRVFSPTPAPDIRPVTPAYNLQNPAYDTPKAYGQESNQPSNALEPYRKPQENTSHKEAEQPNASPAPSRYQTPSVKVPAYSPTPKHEAPVNVEPSYEKYHTPEPVTPAPTTLPPYIKQETERPVYRPPSTYDGPSQKPYEHAGNGDYSQEKPLETKESKYPQGPSYGQPKQKEDPALTLAPVQPNSQAYTSRPPNEASPYREETKPAYSAPSQLSTFSQKPYENQLPTTLPPYQQETLAPYKALGGYTKEPKAPTHYNAASYPTEAPAPFRKPETVGPYYKTTVYPTYSPVTEPPTLTYSRPAPSTYARPDPTYPSVSTSAPELYTPSKPAPVYETPAPFISYPVPKPALHAPAPVISHPVQKPAPHAPAPAAYPVVVHPGKASLPTSSPQKVKYVAKNKPGPINSLYPTNQVPPLAYNPAPQAAYASVAAKPAYAQAAPQSAYAQVTPQISYAPIVQQKPAAYAPPVQPQQPVYQVQHAPQPAYQAPVPSHPVYQAPIAVAPVQPVQQPLVIAPAPVQPVVVPSPQQGIPLPAATPNGAALISSSGSQAADSAAPSGTTGESQWTTGSIPYVIEKLGFNTLNDLVILAGLDPVLEKEGPFTVFVPTDRAFEFLTAKFGGQEAALAQFEKDPEGLKSLLKHHIVPNVIPSVALSDNFILQSVVGSPLRFKITEAEDNDWKPIKVATVNGARILKTDIKATNGIIHIIDRVMFPIPQADVYSTLKGDPQKRFTLLTTAIERAGLAQTLADPRGGPFTLFAPTDKAFKQINRLELNKLLSNPPALSQLLLKHVVKDALYTANLQGYQAPATLAGTPLNLYHMKGATKVNGANVVEPDVPVVNGVIHIIDAVLGF